VKSVTLKYLVKPGDMKPFKKVALVAFFITSNYLRGE